MGMPIARLSALCVLALAPTGFESCVVGNNENVPTFAVSINFGDGEELMTADRAEWEDNRELYGDVMLFFRYGKRLLVSACVWPEGITVFPDEWLANEYLLFEYYSHRWESVKEAIRDNANNLPWGDWQVHSGTVTITALSSTHLSGRAELVMYDFYDYIVNRNDSPAKKLLTVDFSNIPISAGVKNNAVGGAQIARDLTFSFGNAGNSVVNRR